MANKTFTQLKNLNQLIKDYSNSNLSTSGYRNLINLLIDYKSFRKAYKMNNTIYINDLIHFKNTKKDYSFKVYGNKLYTYRGVKK